MIKKRIIPCLLLKNGRCVKGINFTNHRDVGHPITNAKIYDAQGADELILLDITANNENRDILYEIIQKTADECFMPLTVGGGIKTLEDIQKLLRAGADKVAINTHAVDNPEFISKAAEVFGKQCIVISVDYKNNKVYTHSAARKTKKEPVSWAQEAAKRGAGEILLTDIAKEGTRSGYDLEIIKAAVKAVEIPVIASGGAGSLEDLKKAFLEANASAAALASILHFTDQSVIKIRNYLSAEGIEVRIDA